MVQRILDDRLLVFALDLSIRIVMYVNNINFSNSYFYS